jgi:hypothetical protein
MRQNPVTRLTLHSVPNAARRQFTHSHGNSRPDDHSNPQKKRRSTYEKTERPAPMKMENPAIAYTLLQ